MGTTQSQTLHEDSEEVESLVQDNSADVYEKMSGVHGNVDSVIDHFGADLVDSGSPLPFLESMSPKDGIPAMNLSATFLSLTNVEQSCYISVALHLLMRVEQTWVPEQACVDWSQFIPKPSTDQVLKNSTAPASQNVKVSIPSPRDENRDTSSPGGISEFFTLGFTADATWFDQTWLPSLEQPSYDGNSVLTVSIGDTKKQEKDAKKKDDFDLDLIEDEDTDSTMGSHYHRNMTASPVEVSAAEVRIDKGPTQVLPLSSSSNTGTSPIEQLSKITKSGLETKDGEMHANPPASLPRVHNIPELPPTMKLPTSLALFPPSKELAVNLLKLLFSMFPHRHPQAAARARAQKTLAHNQDTLIIFHKLLDLIPQAGGLSQFNKAKPNDALEFFQSLRSVLHYTAIVQYQAQQIILKKQKAFKLPKYLQPLSLMTDICLSSTIPKAQYVPELIAMVCKMQHTRRPCYCCRRLPTSFTNTFSHSSRRVQPCCCLYMPQTPVSSYDELPCVIYVQNTLKYQLLVNYAVKKGFSLGDVARHQSQVDCGAEYRVVQLQNGDLQIIVKSFEFLDLSVFCGQNKNLDLIDNQYIPAVVRSEGYTVIEEDVIEVNSHVLLNGRVNFEILLLGVSEKQQNPRSIRFQTPAAEDVQVPRGVAGKEDVITLDQRIKEDGSIDCDIITLKPALSFLQKIQNSFQLRSTSTVSTTTVSTTTVPTMLSPLCVTSMLNWKYTRHTLPGHLHPSHHTKTCLLQRTEDVTECKLAIKEMTLASGILKQPKLLMLRIDSQAPKTDACDGKKCACSKHHSLHSWLAWNRVAPNFCLPLQHPLLHRHAPFAGQMDYFSLDGFALHTTNNSAGHYEAVVRMDHNAWSHIDGGQVKSVAVHHSHMSSKDVYFAVYTSRDSATSYKNE